MTTETTTPETKPETKPLTKLEFAQRYNRVARGEAKYDERSASVKFEPEVKFEIGQAVPQTRKGVSVFCGLSYNAMLSREKAYIEEGIALNKLPMGKRGSTTDIASINEALAEDNAASEMASDESTD